MSTYQHLILTEAGYPDPDGDWVALGWQAITYEGHQHFFSQDKAAVLGWLTEQGYIERADGFHYHKVMPVPQTVNVLIPCHRISDQARDALAKMGASIHEDVLWGELADVILVVVPCWPGSYQCMWQHGILRDLQTPEVYLTNVHNAQLDQLELQVWDDGEPAEKTPAAPVQNTVSYIDDSDQPF